MVVEYIAILGFYVFCWIWIISIADMILIFRIASGRISKKAVALFIENLRFPVTLIYGGIIGQFADITSNPKTIWVSAQKVKGATREGRKHGLVIVVTLMIIFIGLPLFLFLIGALYSEQSSQQISFGIGVFLPVFTTMVIRPWCFGQSFEAIEEDLQRRG